MTTATILTAADLDALHILNRYGATSAATFARRLTKGVHAADAQLCTLCYRGLATIASRASPYSPAIFALTDEGRAAYAPHAPAMPRARLSA